MWEMCYCGTTGRWKRKCDRGAKCKLRTLCWKYPDGGFKYLFIFTPKLGEDEPNLTSMFFKWVGSTTNYRYSKGPWKWRCQHDHIFEASLAFPYHAAMGIDSLNFQGSFGAGDWCWILMKKTGSVMKYLISELGSYIYIYRSHTTNIYRYEYIARKYRYNSWDYVLCLWLYS